MVLQIVDATPPEMYEASPTGKGYTTFESSGRGSGRHTKLRLVAKR